MARWVYTLEANNEIGNPIKIGTINKTEFETFLTEYEALAREKLGGEINSSTSGWFWSPSDAPMIRCAVGYDTYFGGRSLASVRADYILKTELDEYYGSEGDEQTKARRVFIQNNSLMLYEFFTAFMSSQAAGSDINKDYEEISNKAQNVSYSYAFVTGQTLSTRQESSSYLSHRFRSPNSGNNGIDIPAFCQGQTVGQELARRFGLHSFIYIGDYENPVDALTYAKSSNEYYGYRSQPAYYNATSQKIYGRSNILQVGQGINFTGAFNVSDSDLNKITYEEWFPPQADDENTYPGGGDDKNTYPEDGESGKGTFDNTNDPIDFPAIPTFDATSTGFISMWNPNIVEITNLYGFLWDSDISTTIKKLFIEPMDAIISLSFFPVDPTIDSRRNVTIAHVDTEIEMNHVQKQFVDFDFGSITLDEYYGAAWDYSPYTKASIYLPYIGVHEINIDDVMNATLTLKYRIDLLSGMCAAMLKVIRSRDGLDAVIYTWQGNCAMQVPVSAGSARDFLNSIIQLGAMAGVSIAQPFAGSLDAAMHKGDENYETPVMGNNWINPTIATFSALNVIGQKVHVQRGGRVDANAGVMSPQSAYIILNRPVSAIPRGWNGFAGYPSLKIKALSTQSGYTEVAYIKLNGLEATSEEIMELDGMLKGGVIL